MKASIIKNDNFETIGFVVMAENNTLFSWGVTFTGWNYCKTFDLKDEDIIKVMDLMRMEQEIKDLDHIPSDFMFNSIHKEQHDVIRKAAEKGKCQEGYNCKAFKDRASELKAKVEETIKSFK